MLEYLSPGVYIQDSDRGPHLIQKVKTDIAAFIGFSEKAQRVEKKDGQVVISDLLNKPQRVESWSEYQDLFGGFVEGVYMPYAVYGYFQNNDEVSPCYVLSLHTMSKAETQLFGVNGQPQLKVNAKQAGKEGLRLRVRVEKPAMKDASLLNEPLSEEKEAASKSSLSEQVPSFNLVIEKESLSGRWDQEETEVIEDIRIEEIGQEKKIRFNETIPLSIELKLIEPKDSLPMLLPRTQKQRLHLTEPFLPVLEAKELKGKEGTRTGLEGLRAIDEISMLCFPDLYVSQANKKVDLNKVEQIQAMMIAHCENMGDRMVILDCLPGKTPQDMQRWWKEDLLYDSKFATLYYPWIEINDPLTHHSIVIPPSGHIAGIWARNDNRFGVHKAPANEVVKGVTGLAYSVTKGEQQILNPKGINCIRALPGLGIRLWGARTLSSESNWRYINVRRLFNFVKQSIEQGTDWITFEPNNHDLWPKVRREVNDFLTQEVWEKGMLAGASPQEAFFVKCDEELNDTHTRDEGQLLIDIGLAPISPAEFIIFRLVQRAGPNSE